METCDVGFKIQTYFQLEFLIISFYMAEICYPIVDRISHHIMEINFTRKYRNPVQIFFFFCNVLSDFDVDLISSYLYSIRSMNFNKLIFLLLFAHILFSFTIDNHKPQCRHHSVAYRLAFDPKQSHIKSVRLQGQEWAICPLLQCWYVTNDMTVFLWTKLMFSSELRILRYNAYDHDVNGKMQCDIVRLWC